MSAINGALDGLLIADFSWVGAGPRATKDLADNGATVIKVESRRRLDLGRRSPPFVNNEHKNPDASAFFAQSNTSKQSITINLNDPDGVAVAKQLISHADVVVENFGPGYMERIGLGFDQLTQIKTDIILASVSVAGRSGPMAGFRGYGNSAAAYSGHAALSGWPGSEPHMPPFAYGDVVAPMFLTVGILAALEYRDRTGEGQHIDVSQIEPMVHVIADILEHSDSDDKPANTDTSFCPHAVYPCQGEEQWIALAIADDTQWELFQVIIGTSLPDVFTTQAQRLQHIDQLDAAIMALTQSCEKDELSDALSRAGIAAAPVLNGADIGHHPAYQNSGHFKYIEHPVLGVCRMPTPPMSLQATPGNVSAAPCLGANNQSVFQDQLGLSEQEMNALIESGALV